MAVAKRIEYILGELSKRGKPKIINGVSIRILSGLRKGEIKVKDLGKLQAATGHEDTLLRGKGERVLIRGTPNQVGIPDEYVQNKYVRSGHSHPYDTSPSQADRDALFAFDQEYSVIVSSCPKYKTRRFEQIEDWSGWLP